MEPAGQRILILGLAREGESLARYFATRGAQVTITDSASPAQLAPRLERLAGLPIHFSLGADYPELALHADRFFVSPGVPERNAVYEAAAARLPVESMTTLFFDLCPGRIVGITGSSGKTTTTGLVGHLLRRAGVDVVVGGNIGDPMLDLLPSIRPETTVVLELSSFQLSILRRSPQIAVVTNISPNHLDRHGTMDAYIAAKRNIVCHQSAGDVAVLNAADQVVADFAAATPATVRWFNGVDATVVDGWAGIYHDGFQPVLPVGQIPLLGAHNVENVLAALLTASLLTLDLDALAEGVRSFRPAPHRLELVAEHDGVRFVDDSIATSPARTAVALQAIEDSVLLIAGGRDKHLPWADVADLITDKVRKLFLIGEAADLIAAAVHNAQWRQSGVLESIQHCASLPDAVRAAAAAARPGEVVLLAPGCTSYDMFRDYEERGAAFRQAVEALHAA